MDKVKIIFVYISFGLSFFLLRGQQIGNYVTNGSFEKLKPNAVYPNGSAFPPVYIGWSSIDTTQNGFMSHHVSFGNSPINTSCDRQSGRTGSGFVKHTIYLSNSEGRGYFRNRLKGALSSGVSYCVKYYVNIRECSNVGIDAYAVYFGDNSLDTIHQVYQTKNYLTPQISNPTGNFVTDTTSWTLITGTFTANGNEKYLVIGNFNNSQSTNTIALTTSPPPYYACDINIDDVSVIQLNAAAYAGSDKLILVGDSVFIGRQPDFATDSACIWYKLPNMTTAIDTISGLWVKPSVTSTYVVRQQLDCSSLKWDTVVVKINTNLVGNDKLIRFSDNISIFPNPTSGNLNISFPSQTDIKIYSISNSLGQIIREDEIEIKNSTCSILTSDLKNGLYQIHFKTQFGIVTKKFVKTN